MLGIQILVVLIELLSVLVKFLVQKQTKRSYWVFHCLLVVIARDVIGSYGSVIRHFYYQTDQFGFSISSTEQPSHRANTVLFIRFRLVYRLWFVAYLGFIWA